MFGFILFLLLAIPLICVLIDRYHRYDGSSAETFFKDWLSSKREYERDVKWGRR
jgi:hypothetical protein